MVKLVLALALVAGGAWAWVTTHPSTSLPIQQTISQNSEQKAPVTHEPQPVTTSVSAVTDATLNTDLQSFDTDAQSAASDQTSVESSFNDKPVQQTE